MEGGGGEVMAKWRADPGLDVRIVRVLTTKWPPLEWLLHREESSEMTRS